MLFGALPFCSDQETKDKRTKGNFSIKTIGAVGFRHAPFSILITPFSFILNKTASILNANIAIEIALINILFNLFGVLITLPFVSKIKRYYAKW